MINWKVRFRNKTWLLTFLPVAISAVYNILALLGVAPCVTEDMVIQLLTTVINILAVLGVVTDPTTAGVGDSRRALNYSSPASSAKNTAKASSK